MTQKGTGPEAARTRKEFVVLALLGVTNTLLTLLLYWLLLLWVSHTVAYAASYGAGIVFSAVTNARFTFGTRLTWVRFGMFALWTLGLYAFNAAFLELLVRGIGMDARYAVLVVVCVAVPLGFLGSRWALRRPAARPGV